jgi:hypothetical protein
VKWGLTANLNLQQSRQFNSLKPHEYSEQAKKDGSEMHVGGMNKQAPKKTMAAHPFFLDT